MPPRPLTKFEIQKYYQNEPRFNRVYLRGKLPKISKGVYGGNITYCNSFGVEHIPKEFKKFIGNKNIITNIYRIQA